MRGSQGNPGQRHPNYKTGSAVTLTHSFLCICSQDDVISVLNLALQTCRWNYLSCVFKRKAKGFMEYIGVLEKHYIRLQVSYCHPPQKKSYIKSGLLSVSLFVSVLYFIKVIFYMRFKCRETNWRMHRHYTLHDSCTVSKIFFWLLNSIKWMNHKSQYPLNGGKWITSRK